MVFCGIKFTSFLILKIREIFSEIFFIFSIFFTYFIGLAYYDSTNGLDFNRYIRNIKFFQGDSINIYDGQGSLYFFLMSKFVGSYGNLENYVGNIKVNNSIQFFNFILFCVGLFGLFRLGKFYRESNETIFIALGILCYFPPAFYLRLTMKPEILAFALLPWCILFSNKYLLEKNNMKTYFLSFLLAILLTLKASITGMVILSFLYIFNDEIKQIKKHLLLLYSSLTLSLLGLIFSYTSTSRWLFSQPFNPTKELRDRWNNTATLEFFVNINFYDLFANPYKHLHSDSLISITLLDTLSDYFTFFWNHRQLTNYLAYNRIEFTENFLVQMFLPQYISIVFTVIFYSVIFIVYFKKIDKTKLAILPLFGIFILSLNALGIPSKNFDPTTGDLFKVHYYSFLICISFFVVVNLILKYLNKYRFAVYLLIPIFLISMGFPKFHDPEISKELYEKLNHSEICFLISLKSELHCDY